MDPLTALAISGGVKLGGDIAGGLFAGKRAKDAFFRNRDFFWQVADYNSPKNQMARYREAGLNPNLMYGQGNPGNAQQTMPQYRPPEYQFTAPDVLGMLGQYQQLKVAHEQEKNISADTANKTTQNLIMKLDEQIKNAEFAIKSNRQSWEEQTVYDEKSGRNISKFEQMNNELLKMQKMRNNMMEQSYKQALKFYKYMDYSQIGGVAGDVMKVLAPIMNLIGALRGQNINQAIQMAK